MSQIIKIAKTSDLQPIIAFAEDYYNDSPRMLTYILDWIRGADVYAAYNQEKIEGIAMVQDVTLEHKLETSLDSDPEKLPPDARDIEFLPRKCESFPTIRIGDIFTKEDAGKALYEAALPLAIARSPHEIYLWTHCPEGIDDKFISRDFHKSMFSGMDWEKDYLRGRNLFIDYNYRVLKIEGSFFENEDTRVLTEKYGPLLDKLTYNNFLFSKLMDTGMQSFVFRFVKIAQAYGEFLGVDAGTFAMEDFDDITDKGNPNELSMLYWATSANREAGKEIIHIEKIDGRNVYTPTKDLFSIIEKTPLERDVGLISHFTRFSSSYGLANALVMIYEATGRSISVLYENLESIGMPKPEFVEHLSFPVNINTLGAWAAANENKIYEHSVKCIKESPYVHGVIPLDRWVELNKADLHPNLAAHLYPSK